VKLSALKGKYLILAITVPVVVIADQLTKILAIIHLRPLVIEARPHDRFLTVIDGFFRLKYAENAGAAWGIGRNWPAGIRITFFIVISLVAIAVIIWFFKRIEAKQRLLPTAVALVLGGAIGNLIDRVRMGKVVDFVDWYVTFESKTDLLLFTVNPGEKHWPTFNVADAAISIGVILLLIEMAFGQKLEGEGGEETKKKKKEKKKKD
jgi:signal peptidase II